MKLYLKNSKKFRTQLNSNFGIGSFLQRSNNPSQQGTAVRIYRYHVGTFLGRYLCRVTQKPLTENENPFLLHSKKNLSILSKTQKFYQKPKNPKTKTQMSTAKTLARVLRFLPPLLLVTTPLSFVVFFIGRARNYPAPRRVIVVRVWCYVPSTS